MSVKRNDFAEPRKERELYIRDHVERGLRLIAGTRTDGKAIIQCHGMTASFHPHPQDLLGCALTKDDARALIDALQDYVR